MRLVTEDPRAADDVDTLVGPRVAWMQAELVKLRTWQLNIDRAKRLHSHQNLVLLLQMTGLCLGGLAVLGAGPSGRILARLTWLIPLHAVLVLLGIKVAASTADRQAGEEGRSLLRLARWMVLLSGSLAVGIWAWALLAARAVWRHRCA